MHALVKQKVREYFVAAVASVAMVLLIIENTAFGDAHALAFSGVNLAVWLLLIADVLYRLQKSDGRAAHLRRHWPEFIVFLPLVQYFPGVHHPSAFTIVRQTVIVVMLLVRIRKATGLVHLLELKPAQALIGGFFGAIVVGSILLTLPMATVTGERLPVIDAVFTATSAVCVTGLIVRDTATYFSTFGQLVILALIQVGGLGIMTFSAAFLVLLKKPMGLGQRAALRDALDYETLAGVRRLILFIVFMTVVIEFAGAVALFLSWRGHFSSVSSAIYHSLFHAVSAFCNAGFSTFSDSLMGFQSDAGVNATICALIVLGGLGFVVVMELAEPMRSRLRGTARAKTPLQARVVLRTSFWLVLGGTVVVYLTERTGLLAGLTAKGGFLGALFQSVTARTAGFNTLDIGLLSPATLFVTIVLMFIGASPGSTGGGIKTTTVATLWAVVRTSLRNRPHVEMYRHTIPPDTVQKAVTLLCVSLSVVVLFTLALLGLEGKPFLDTLFEVVSAYGTVGLSAGITPQLSGGGRILITLLMFIGRLGPLTVAYAMIPARARITYKYAEERIMIG